MTAATIQNIEKLIASGALYETVKDAYENALKLNPSATEAWISYVNYEKSKENAENVKLIYLRCISLLLNVKLAEDYVDFVISGTIPEDQNIKQVGTEAFEFAINSVGIDLESGSLWLKYAAFVSSWKSENALEDAQKIQMIRKIYHRAVSVPLNDIESVWKQYDAFENELSRSTAKQFTTEISPQYMKARLCVKPLKDFYASLFEEKYESTGAPVWTDLEKRLLKAFQRWLQWEKSDPVALQDAEFLSQRVMYCIKKSLSLLRHFPEVWLDGGRFLRANGKDSEAVDFLKQGIEANSKSLLITFYATELYESVQQFDQAKILFEDLIKSYEQDYLMCRNSVESTEESMKSREKALKGTENVAEEADEESSDDDINRNNLLVNDAEYVKLKDTLMMHKKTEDILSRKLNCIWIQFMKYSRRTEGMKGARQVFSRARKTKYCSFHIFTASALFEYQCNKDKDVSFKIFEVGMKNFGDDPLYIKEYLNHLIAVADDNNVRSLCERTFSTLSGSNIVPILNEYLQYENLYGDLPSVLSIEQRLQTIAGTEPEIKLLLSRYEFLDLNDVLEKEVGFVPERRSSVAFALPISTDAMKVETGKTSIPKKRETVILPAMKDEENLYPAKKRALAYSYGSIFPKPNLNNYNSFTPEPSADGVASAESAFSSYSKSNLMAPAPGGIPQSITLLLKILPEKSQFQGPFVDPEDVVELLLAASLPPSKGLCISRNLRVDYRSSKRSRRE